MTKALSESESPRETELVKLLGDLRTAASLDMKDAVSTPPAAYTSSELLELERREIFGKEWMCVGREDELSTAGDYFTIELQGVPVVITRDLDNKLQALVNVCRHRMAQLVSGSGKTRVLTCPYHSWAYSLSGKLMNAPKMDEKEFNKAECNLKRLPLETWLGFIFVNLDSEAAPLSPRLEGLAATLKNFRIDQMNVLWKEEQVWDTNWKIACENFLEVYHIESLHPGNLFEYVGGAENATTVDTSNAYTFYKMHGHEMTTSDMIAGIREASLPGELIDNPDLTDEDYRWSYVGAIYPGFLLAISWFGGIIFSVQPVSTGKVKVLYVGFAPVTGISFNSEEAQAFHVKWLNDAATAEDKVVVAGIQRNAESGFGKSGPIHIEHEETIKNFLQYISNKVSS